MHVSKSVSNAYNDCKQKYNLTDNSLVSTKNTTLQWQW